jgi:hypothetical protein
VSPALRSTQVHARVPPTTALQTGLARGCRSGSQKWERRPMRWKRLLCRGASRTPMPGTWRMASGGGRYCGNRHAGLTCARTPLSLTDLMQTGSFLPNDIEIYCPVYVPSLARCASWFPCGHLQVDLRLRIWALAPNWGSEGVTPCSFGDHHSSRPHPCTSPVRRNSRW